MFTAKLGLSLLLSMGLSMAAAQSPEKPGTLPQQPDKSCNCENRFKTCKKFARKKEAVKACEDDRRSCQESCHQ